MNQEACEDIFNTKPTNKSPYILKCALQHINIFPQKTTRSNLKEKETFK